jgi:hypothetical protein
MEYRMTEERMTEIKYYGTGFFSATFADADSALAELEPLTISEYVANRSQQEGTHGPIYLNLQEAFAAARDGNKVNFDALREAALLVGQEYATAKHNAVASKRVGRGGSADLAKLTKCWNGLMAAVARVDADKPLTSDDVNATRRMMAEANDPRRDQSDEVVSAALEDRNDGILKGEVDRIKHKKPSRAEKLFAAEVASVSAEVQDINARRAAVLYKEIEALATALGVNDIPPLDTSFRRNTDSDSRSNAR